MSCNWKVATVFLLCICALVLATRVNGQTVQGQINGTVTDPSGNVVPGAPIVLKSLDMTNTTRKTVSEAWPVPRITIERSE